MPTCHHRGPTHSLLVGETGVCVLPVSSHWDVMLKALLVGQEKHVAGSLVSSLKYAVL